MRRFPQSLVSLSTSTLLRSIGSTSKNSPQRRIVHRGPNGELAVVGVFIEEGGEADELTELWSQLPQTEGESLELSAVQFDEQAL